MTMRAVIFDFGGVLVRGESWPYRRRWEERLGLAPGELNQWVSESPQAQRALVGLAPEIAIWQNIAAHFGLNDAAMRQLEGEFWQGEALDTELIAFLRSLRPRYATAVLSNAWSDARRAFVAKFGLDQVVDLIITSAEEGIAKPDAAIFLLAAQRLGVRPEEAIFVDDSAANTAAAAGVGMHAVRFQNTAQTLADVRRLLAE